MKNILKNNTKVIIQCSIIILIAVMSIFISALEYNDHIFTLRKNNLNNVVSLLKMNNLIGSNYLDNIKLNNLLIYTINAKDGSLIKQRFSNKTPDKIWEIYKNKIIYKMQKNKQGLLFYPEVRNILSINKKRIIAYSFVSENNLIFAVEDIGLETILASNIRETVGFIFKIFIVILIGCLALIRTYQRPPQPRIFTFVDKIKSQDEEESRGLTASSEKITKDTSEPSITEREIEKPKTEASIDQKEHIIEGAEPFEPKKSIIAEAYTISTGNKKNDNNKEHTKDNIEKDDSSLNVDKSSPKNINSNYLNKMIKEMHK